MALSLPLALAAHPVAGALAAAFGVALTFLSVMILRYEREAAADAPLAVSLPDVLVEPSPAPIHEALAAVRSLDEHRRRVAAG